MKTVQDVRRSWIRTCCGARWKPIRNKLLVRKLGQWVPHALEQYDMDRRADMALYLLTLKRTHTCLDHLVTGDEKWSNYSKVHRRAQWVDKGAHAEDFPKHNVHAKKVMLCIWWSIHGVE
ncbi:hypothetical protein V3C99_018382 [Haemonchus contortus]|uniref:Endonuclease-reverse transcriptase n=1 Tax=Haemonchus contortus TaxID=6289 RepID=A0A7I4Z0S4_HAECO